VVTPAQHEAVVAAVVESFAGLDRGVPVRLAKRTTNLFRPRATPLGPGLDVSGLTGVVEVDPVAGTATVQGMATYETVVDATLARGVMPLVVPQLRTITVGGAVTGLGIEASSFRHGLPHESVRSMDILVGTGEIVTAAPTGPHADLYRAFPNSYGSLGYAVTLTIDVEPVAPFVRLRHVPFDNLGKLADAVAHVVTARAWDGEPVDFLDGVVFGRHTAYLTMGRWEQGLDAAERPSDYAGQRIYYRSIQQRATDVLTVQDYLWRWDTDWFWCSRAFGVPSGPWCGGCGQSGGSSAADVYWNGWSRLDHQARDRGDARSTGGVDGPSASGWCRTSRFPLERTVGVPAIGSFDHVPIEPIWLCPIALREPGLGAAGASEAPWPLYPMRRGETYVNVGFWSSVPIRPGRADGDVNWEIERVVSDLGGHKSLYSDAYYSREEFESRYGGTTYQQVKATYDPDGRFPGLYDKAVRRR
jgi:FAD/FMN-containing dehydrogenase